MAAAGMLRTEVVEELRDPVLIFDYDAAWPVRYRIEAQLMRVVLADLSPQVEHIGSTSVIGLAAKPVIDILVGVPELAAFDRQPERLASYGYQYVKAYERSLPDRRFFKRVLDGARTHHVHVVEADGAYWKRYVAFRDALRDSAELRQQYERLKRGLAVRYCYDRDAYTAGKTGFVESVLAGQTRAALEHAPVSGVDPAYVA